MVDSPSFSFRFFFPGVTIWRKLTHFTCNIAHMHAFICRRIVMVFCGLFYVPGNSDMHDQICSVVYYSSFFFIFIQTKNHVWLDNLCIVSLAVVFLFSCPLRRLFAARHMIWSAMKNKYYQACEVHSYYNCSTIWCTTLHLSPVYYDSLTSTM